jgi:predicted small lipoprotein YifL
MPFFIPKNKPSLRNFFTLSLAVVVIVLLAACGIKQGHLNPPSGDAAPKFPKTYPAHDAAP